MAESEPSVNNFMYIIYFLVFVACLLNLLGVVAIFRAKQSNVLFSAVLAYYAYILPIVLLASILNYFSWLNLIKILLLFLLNLIFIHLAIFLLKNQ
jgi:hypothetical protein